MKFLHSIVLFLLISRSLSATTYYIAPNGSNTNDGSIGSPWLTLFYACSHATKSGDIIHVNAGTYTETAQSELAVSVSIEGEGDISHIISHHANTGYFECLIILIGGTNTAQHISGLKFDGDNLTGYQGIGVYQRSNVSIYKCTIVDFLHDGVLFGGSGSSNNSFHDNIMTNCAGGIGSGFGDEGDALKITQQTNFLCYNNTITQTERSGGLLVGNGIAGYEASYGTKIYNNTISTIIPYVDIEGYKWVFAIEFWFTVGLEMYGNTISGITDICKEADKGIYDYSVYLHHNTFGWPTPLTTPPREFVSVSFERTLADAIICNNIFSNTPTGLIFTLYDDPTSYMENVWIYNNIFTGIGEAGAWRGALWFNTSAPPTHIKNVYIYNNTILAKTTTPAYYGIYLPTADKCSNIYIRNNIIQGFSIASIFAEKQYSGGTLDLLYIQNNLLNNNGNSNAPKYVSFTPTNVTYQNNVINENPDFVSSTDFHLQTSSPAIGRGTYIGLNTDKDGVNWNNPPSIGAYEYPRIIENHPPSIQDQGFRLNENSPVGTSVGIVVASDPDAGQTLTYSIVSGNTNGTFAINALTGVLSVANGAALTVDFSLVVKVQDNGDGELSSLATIAIDVIPTGIELTDNNGAIKVYPNPVYDELIIELKGNNNRLRFNIMNSKGQIVFEGNLEEKTVIQTSYFSPGVYLMKTGDGKRLEFTKIIKV